MRDETKSVPLLLGLALGAAAYVAAHSFHVPVLTYLPVTGEWTVREPPGAIAMHYFGVVLYGLGFGALGFALGHIRPLAQRLRGRALPTVALALLTGGLAYFLIRELTHWS